MAAAGGDAGPSARHGHGEHLRAVGLQHVAPGVGRHGRRGPGQLGRAFLEDVRVDTDASSVDQLATKGTGERGRTRPSEREQHTGGVMAPVPPTPREGEEHQTCAVQDGVDAADPASGADGVAPVRHSRRGGGQGGDHAKPDQSLRRLSAPRAA